MPRNPVLPLVEHHVVQQLVAVAPAAAMHHDDDRAVRVPAGVVHVQQFVGRVRAVLHVDLVGIARPLGTPCRDRRSSTAVSARLMTSPPKLLVVWFHVPAPIVWPVWIDAARENRTMVQLLPRFGVTVVSTSSTPSKDRYGRREVGRYFTSGRAETVFLTASCALPDLSRISAMASFSLTANVVPAVSVNSVDRSAGSYHQPFSPLANSYSGLNTGPNVVPCGIIAASKAVRMFTHAPLGRPRPPRVAGILRAHRLGGCDLGLRVDPGDGD